MKGPDKTRSAMDPVKIQEFVDVSRKTQAEKIRQQLLEEQRIGLENQLAQRKADMERELEEEKRKRMENLQAEEDQMRRQMEEEYKKSSPTEEAPKLRNGYTEEEWKKWEEEKYGKSTA